MCKYCDINSKDCEVFYSPFTREWYIEVRTDEVDEVTNDWIYQSVYGINFCPYCGQELNKK